MARTIKFEGRSISVPDDATDDEISEILGGSAAPSAPINKPTTTSESSKKGFSISDVFSPIIAPAEVALQIGTGLAGQIGGGYRGLYNLLTGEGLDASANAVRKTQEAITYQPKAELSKGLSEAVAYPFQKAMEATKTAGGFIGEKVGGEQGRIAGEAIGEQVIPVAGTVMPGVKAIGATRAGPSSAAMSAEIEAIKNAAPKIAVAKEGNALGFVFDVNEVNPSAPLGARIAAGPKLDMLAAKKNLDAAQNVLKKEIGLSADDQLNRAAINARIETLGKEYEVVRNIGQLKANEDIASRLRSSIVDEIPGKEEAARNANRVLLDNANDIANGTLTGDKAVSRIKEYRKSSQKIKDSSASDEAALMKADAYKKVADILEDVVEASISDKTVLANFRKAREGIAKAYTVNGITNPVTGVPNLQLLTSGKLADAPLTGGLASLRNIATAFPEVTSNVSKYGDVVTTLPRTSVGGTAGAAVGSAVGNTGLGASVGSVIDVLGGNWNRRRTLTPEYQAANLFPEYTRFIHPDEKGMLQIQSPLLQSKQPTVSPAPNPNLPVPYSYSGVLNPAEPYRPNFTMRQGQGLRPDAPDITPQGPQPQWPKLGFNPESQGRNAFQNAALSDRLKGIADQQAAARESASRQPASGGMLYELDPITGKLRAADQGIKGATPSQISNFGNDLSSASNKIASGQRFSMTPEEKIAWSKAKVDIEQAAPQLRGLSDDAIASKIADRAWVAKRVEELKTEYADWAKSAAERFNKERSDFINEVANSKQFMGKTEREMKQVANAEAARRMQRMIVQRKAEIQAKIDSLESMSDTFGQRAGTRIYVGQGPKTRAAQRGMLYGEQQ